MKNLVSHDDKGLGIMWYFFFFVGLICISLIYLNTKYENPGELDSFRWSAFLAFCFLVVGMAVMTFSRGRNRWQDGEIWVVWMQIWVPIGLISLGFGLIVAALLSIAGDLYEFLLNPATRQGRVSITVAVVAAVGSVLFFFRLHLRSVYGATEAIVGLTAAAQFVLKDPNAALPTSPDLLFAMLTASVYLVVRGLDNVHQGYSKEPRDILVSKFLLWKSTKIPQIIQK